MNLYCQKKIEARTKLKRYSIHHHKGIATNEYCFEDRSTTYSHDYLSIGMRSADHWTMMVLG